MGKVGEGATVADEAGLQEQLGDLEHWFNDDFRLVKLQKKKKREKLKECFLLVVGVAVPKDWCKCKQQTATMHGVE